jgi:hypothetical protein
MALSVNLVHEQLRAATRKLRVSRSVRYALVGVSGALLLLLVGLLLDARLHFDYLGRWISFLLTIAPLVVGGLMTAWAWRPMVSEESLARRIESKSSLRGNILISAVQFDRELPPDSPLRRAVFAEMSDPFPAVQWANVFDAELLKRLGLALGGVLVAMIIWAVISPDHFTNSAARIILPGSNIAPLTRTQIIEVTPGQTQIIHGREFATTVKLDGEIPHAAWIYFRELGSTWQKQPMSREVGMPLFNYRWKEVLQTMDFYIVANDAQSAQYRVTVRPATAISARVAEVKLPPYTHAAPVTVKDFNILQNVLPGSVVTVTLDFNYPLAELRATDEKAQALAVTKVTEKQWRVSDRIPANRTVTLSYRDTDNIADRDTLQVATRGDEPPKIEITAPAEGKELAGTRDSVIEIKFAASDNYGLGSVALYRSTQESETGHLVQEWKDVSGKAAFSGTAQVALALFAKTAEERLRFVLVAKDQNDVTGPGVTISRPIPVVLKQAETLAAQKEAQASKLQKSLEEMIKLQKTNLDETRAAYRMKPMPADAAAPLLARQTQVLEMGRTLVGSADVIATKVRETLRSLVNKEMNEAVMTLRDSGAAADPAARAKFVSRAIDVEVAILAQLVGTPEAVADAALKAKLADLLGGIHGLLEKQQKLQIETKKAGEDAAKPLATRQESLAEQSQQVRKELGNPPLDQAKLADVLKQAAAKFGAMKIYEDMLGAAEEIETKKLQPATDTQQRVINNLKQIIRFIEDGQKMQGAANLDKLRAQLAAIKAKLDTLLALQKDVVEKSKDWLHKGKMDPEDVALAEEIKKTKQLMESVLEQMLVDAHVWPDIQSYEELRMAVNEIFEDVIQADKEDIEKGALKPQEIAVQKEDGLMAAIEKAKKIEEDMEAWLPQKSDTTKWLDENFDKREMPDMPNLPLPDAMDDIVGNLLKEQQDIKEEAQDAASNQALAQAAQGWEIADGPMPGFSAQGKSGNTPPNKNIQNGRSSGGRQGMSDGEMVGGKTQNLEGSDLDARRSNSKMSRGQIEDPDGPTTTKATDAGGKAGAFGDRMGMEGNAPLRGSQAPRKLAADALAVQQELLKNKTAKAVTQAQMLNLRADGLADVARLQEQAAWALKYGKLGDYGQLKAQIIRKLQEVKSGLGSGGVVQLAGDNAARAEEKQLLGSSEGSVPTHYKDMMAEYYRSLAEGK